MNVRSRMRISNRMMATAALVALIVCASPGVDAQERRMHGVARGLFTVTLAPQGEPQSSEGLTLERSSLVKQFEGDFVGTGQGEMLTGTTGVQGSAGYVAIERVTGTLNGRTGSFLFQHFGIMTRGTQQLVITVVPDSGTGGLVGIAGNFRLQVAEGNHFYEFDYSLPE